MKLIKWFVEFLITASIVFIVTALVVYLYNTLAHGEGIINWATPIRFAIIFGILIPLMNFRKKKKQSL